ncbi:MULTISPECIES: hypothetical protein [unclassified Nostoc]|nr:hypothetical protein [Nostoc sp. JL23]
MTDRQVLGGQRCHHSLSAIAPLFFFELRKRRSCGESDAARRWLR